MKRAHCLQFLGHCTKLSNDDSDDTIIVSTALVDAPNKPSLTLAAEHTGAFVLMKECYGRYSHRKENELELSLLKMYSVSVPTPNRRRSRGISLYMPGMGRTEHQRKPSATGRDIL